jgi:hypothetical protein
MAEAGADAGYHILQVSADDALEASAGAGALAYQQQAQDSQDDAQMPQDLNALMPQVLLQDKARSQSTGGRLEAGVPKEGVLGVMGGFRASSGGRRRPAAASTIKQTLFDFTPAEPVHAEVHYLRTADQEDFR